jgi:hypothetical protein
MADTQGMTADAAVLAVSIALMGGYAWARWRQRENANQTAKTVAANAGRQVWRARGWLLLAGVVVFALVDLWFRGSGR